MRGITFFGFLGVWSGPTANYHGWQRADSRAKSGTKVNITLDCSDIERPGWSSKYRAGPMRLCWRSHWVEDVEKIEARRRKCEHGWGSAHANTEFQLSILQNELIAYEYELIAYEYECMQIKSVDAKAMV
jgi:hypothetical protein